MRFNQTALGRKLAGDVLECTQRHIARATGKPVLRGLVLNQAEEAQMIVQGTIPGGYKTVGQIVATNALRFNAKQNGLAIAVELLSSHSSGAPVVDDHGTFIGFISEFDLLGAIESGKDLNKTTADQIMNKGHIAAHESMSITDAIKLMKEKHLLHLPVEKNGGVTYSITRHDLLRSRIGLGLDIES
jgi:predicted transcriptional regulator